MNRPKWKEILSAMPVNQPVEVSSASGAISMRAAGRKYGVKITTRKGETGVWQAWRVK